MSDSAAKAVVDSNLLVRGVLGRRPTSVAVRLHRAILLRRFRLVISDYILDEVRDVLASPELQETGAPPPVVIDQILAALRLSAEVVAGDFEVTLVPGDPKDNPVVACALEGDAEYIVTDDRSTSCPSGRCASRATVPSASSAHMISCAASPSLEGSASNGKA